jgi:hypothetical protein
MELRDRLNEILEGGEHLKVSRLTGKRLGFELSYSSMYESPVINFARLKALSDLFGTEAIDVDDYANAGCETCDWGSDYGHTIQVYEPTANEAGMDLLVGLDLKVPVSKGATT